MSASAKPEINVDDLADERDRLVEAEEIKHGRIKPKWEPKYWRPSYDRIVAYSAMGKSNVWISEELDFTPEHISTILNTPEGLALMAKLQAKLRENIVINIPDVLADIASKAASRLREIMNDDDLFEKSPFAVVDRGLDVLKGLNHLRGGGNGAIQPMGNTTNIGSIVLAPGQHSDIMEGLQKIAEIKQIHGNPASTAAKKLEG